MIETENNEAERITKEVVELIRKNGGAVKAETMIEILLMLSVRIASEMNIPKDEILGYLIGKLQLAQSVFFESK